MTGPHTAAPALSTPKRGRLGVRWWPSGLGLLFALGIGFGLGTGFATIVVVCAAIYLLAAAVGRPGAAWLGFAASVPVVGLGRLVDAEWISLALTAALMGVLVFVGMARGAWRASERRRQLIGAAVFGAIAIVALAASASSPAAGAILISAGLLGHALWDVVHHRRQEVVTRPYAEFCAVLDVVLAVAVIVLLLR